MLLEFLAWNSPPLDFSRTPVTVILKRNINKNSNSVITRRKRKKKEKEERERERKKKGKKITTAKKTEIKKYIYNTNISI